MDSGKSPYLALAILLTLILFAPAGASGQRKSDIGIIGGVSYYMGDFNHAQHFYELGPGGGFIYRYDFNPRNSIRFNALYATLKGDPADQDQPYPGSPADAFSAGVLDVGISSEFNFMPYETTKIRKNRYTPYVSGGIGYSIIFGQGQTPALNFGVGFKFNVTTRLSTGAEWTFRKTFSDEIDGYRNIGSDVKSTFFHNKDWYSLVGIFITYKIFDWGLDCPAYE